MGEGEERSDIAVLKSQVRQLQADVEGLERDGKERDKRDQSFLIRALWTVGGLLATAFAFLWAAIKDRFGL